MESTKPFEITIRIEVPQVYAILDSALGTGHISYWAERVELLEDDSLRITEREGGAAHVLNREALQRGLTLLANGSVRDLTDLMRGRGDRFTGDILIQLSIFGRVVYG
jgi:hypothetical protein